MECDEDVAKPGSVPEWILRMAQTSSQQAAIRDCPSGFGDKGGLPSSQESPGQSKDCLGATGARYQGQPRVARRMRHMGLESRTRRKFRVTTNSRHNHPVAANLLQRSFSTDHPNRFWVSDITYVRTREGWLYLAVLSICFPGQWWVGLSVIPWGMK